jgi:flavin reductase (DIM6/NTAB) family NADH-FMN oxidoreductase RutF
MEFDSRDFRRAMGCFATGITIVSTLAPGGARIGLTVNSFSSVSLDPPLVSFCLARSASRYAEFMATDHYAVNVVGAAQQAFSSKFARTGEGDWGDLPMETWETGAPILPGAIANIECTVHDRFDAGDHVIMVGRVLRLRTDPDVPPLLYYQGAYRLLAPSK